MKRKLFRQRKSKKKRKQRKLTFDELDEVTGGSLSDAKAKKKTSSISDDTRSKI